MLRIRRETSRGTGAAMRRALLRIADQRATRGPEQDRTAGWWTLELLERRVLLSNTGYPIPGSVDGVQSGYAGTLIADGHNDLWFADQGTNSIDQIAPDGSVKAYAIPTTGADPWAIAVGPDGNIWFTETGANQIGRLTRRGEFTEFSLPTPNVAPSYITAGPDGNLWFTENNASVIGRITPQGAVTEFKLGSTFAFESGQIVSAYGRLWFLGGSDGSGFYNNALGSIDTNGVVHAATLGGHNLASDMTRTSDGFLWIDAVGSINRVSPDGTLMAYASPETGGWPMVAAADGGLWYSNNDSQIEHITPTGDVSQLTPEIGSDTVGDLAVSSDGTLWCLNAPGSVIYRLAPPVDPALLASALRVSITGINTIQGPVASFTDQAWETTAADYTATLDWEDGISAPGIITPGIIAPNGAGFDVSTTHAWPLDSSELTVTITDTKSPTADPVAGRTAVAQITLGGGSDVSPKSPWMVADPQGNVAYGFPGGSTIGEIAVDGTKQNIQLPAGSGTLSSATPAGNGAFWVTTQSPGGIRLLSAAGQFTAAQPIPGTPGAVTLGSDGNFWFIDSRATSAGFSIGRLTASSGQFTDFPFSTLQLNPNCIATGSDGNVWFLATDAQYDAYVGRITPEGQTTFFRVHSGSTDIIAGADGNLWVSTEGGGTIERVTTAGVVTPFAVPDQYFITTLAASPDGGLWFGLEPWNFSVPANQFGCITPDGIVHQYALPGTDGQGNPLAVTALSVSPDRTLWYLGTVDAVPHEIKLSHDLLATSLKPPAVVAASPVTVTVARFTDPSGGSDPSAYAATINWGNATLPGVITVDPGGGFDVSGTYTFAIDGSAPTAPWPVPDRVQVTITNALGNVAQATSPVYTNNPPVVGISVPIQATAGQVFSGSVAQFAEVGLNNLSIYSATIHWGDGHTTDGVLAPNADGGLDVSGTSTFAHSGTQAINVSLNIRGFYNFGVVSLATASSTAAIALGTMDGTGATVNGPSADFTGVIAGFTPAVPVTDLSHYRAAVSWSTPATAQNGQPIGDWPLDLPRSSATLVPDGRGGFEVSASARFAQAGTYIATVLITDTRLAAGPTPVVGAAYAQVTVPAPVPDPGGNDPAPPAPVPPAPVTDPVGDAPAPSSGDESAIAFNAGLPPQPVLNGTTPPPSTTLDWNDGKSPLDQTAAGDQGILDPAG